MARITDMYNRVYEGFNYEEDEDLEIAEQVLKDFAGQINEIDGSSGDTTIENGRARFDCSFLIPNDEEDVLGFTLTLDKKETGGFEFYGWIENNTADLGLWDSWPLLSNNPVSEDVEKPEDIFKFIDTVNDRIDALYNELI
jgi:hypothetical protein